MKRHISLLILLFSVYMGFSQVVEADSLYLVEIYNRTGGDSWNNNTNWLDTSVSLWYGVTVRDSYVVAIDLSNNNLNGMIDFPTILGQYYGLLHLERLDLSDNPNLYLSAEIKAGWFPLLSSLYYLDMSRNQDDMLHFSLHDGLQYFAFADKNLDSIPSTALASVTTLKYIDFSGNKLTALPKGLEKSTGLRILKAAYNSLTDPGPIAGFSSLVHLDLESNMLNSYDTLTGLQGLTYLNIKGNQLKGDITELSQGFEGVDTLIVAFNSFTGVIDSAAQYWTGTVYLDIGTNNLEGNLNAFFDLNQLKVLIANDNNIKGTLDSITLLYNLEYLNLGGDSLTGQLSEGVMNMPFLKVLYVNRNHLEGQLPDAGNLCVLQKINVADNNFTGNIPASWWLPSLNYLNVSGNKLSGGLDSNMLNSPYLEYLILSRNYFKGQMPSYLSSLSNLKTLDISENFFDSSVDLTPLTRLEHLYIQKNYLDYKDYTDLGFFPSDLVYLPQRRFPVYTEDLGDSVKIVVDFYKSNPGINTFFFWFNQDQQIQTSGDSVFVVAKTDTGAFYCKILVTNFFGTLYWYESMPYVQHIPVVSGLDSVEYAALARFYDSTGGDSWNNNRFWLTDTSAEYWHGLEIGNGIHIKSIKLQANNLRGNVPDLSDLRFLNQLDLSFNFLDSISDLDKLLYLTDVNISSNLLHSLPKFCDTVTTLDVSNNYLDFGDLEPVYGQLTGANITSFPQRKVGEYQLLAPSVGDRVVLDIKVGGSANRYSWYKDDKLISEGTDPSYVIDSFAFADTGVYYCKISSTLSYFSGDTLQSENYKIIKAFTVTFNVSDTSGMPLSNVEVFLSGYEPVMTDRDGIAKIKYVKEARRLRYYLTKDGYFTVQNALDVNDNIEVDVQMYPVYLKAVFSEIYRPLTGKQVTFYSVSGDSLVEVFTTDDSGKIFYYPLLNGVYYLETYPTPYRKILDTFTVNENNIERYYKVEYNSLNTVQLYPNPTSGTVNLFLINPQDSLEINLYTQEGYKLFSRKYYNIRTTQIRLPDNLPNGRYLLEVKNATVRRLEYIILLR